MTKEELNRILADHALWFENKGGKKANLRGADLREADLLCADLRGAKLQEANLRWANLREADLREADLREAYIREAYIQGADIQGAQLQGADLQNTDLRGAKLQEANLRWANLRGAKLQEADLRGVDLRGVDLQGAYIQGADLREVVADELTSGFWSVCPEKGSFVAFKKLAGGAIAELFIPEHAKRSSATTRKCRCSEAIVVEIKDREGNDIDEGFSQQEFIGGCKLIYKVGEAVYPDGFDENRWNECSNGIHFFMTRREAEIY